MDTLNILISSTRQWNPGDEFILLGVRNLLNEAINKPINWVLYDRNPDLFVDGWNNALHKELFWTNAFSRRNFVPFDLAVIAGTPEWFGKPMVSFYETVRKYEIPLIIIGAGYYSDAPIDFSEDEKYCLNKLSKIITVRDNYASKVFSNMNLPHLILPGPALFASPDHFYPTSAERIGFILQTDETPPHSITSSLKDAGIKAAIDGQKNGFDVEIVCFYIDELAELIQKEITQVRYSYASIDYLSILKSYDVIVSTRLHGAILANSLGKPAFLLNKDPRCKGSAELFPFIFMEHPENVVTKLKKIDVAAVGKGLQQWRERTKSEYMALLNHNRAVYDSTNMMMQRMRLQTYYNLGTENPEITVNNSNTVQAKDTYISQLHNALQIKDARIKGLETQIRQMQRGLDMKLLIKYQRIIEKLLPMGTRRRNIYELAVFRTLLNQCQRYAQKAWK
jgi:hypothetical protein